MAVADGRLYWSNGDAGLVVKVPTKGGKPTILAQRQPGPGGIAADGTNVYYVAGDEVWRVPAGGGDPVSLECSHKSQGAIALHAKHVYWANEEGIVRYPR
jgi:hypothetical protein